MTIAYMVANRAKRPIRGRRYSPNLPIFWSKAEAKWASEQYGKRAMVIRVVIWETLLRKIDLKKKPDPISVTPVWPPKKRRLKK